MDLTADAIAEIERLAVHASGAKANTVNIAHGRATVFNTQTGVMTHVEVPQPPPDVTVSSIEDLVSVYQKFGKTDGTVWVSDESVTVLFDDRRIGKAVMKLRLNPAIAVLKSLQGKAPPALRQILKVNLYGLEVSPNDFCEVISNLKFEATATNDIKIQKGDESIGKSIRSKVTSESSVPDEVSFTMAVYPDLEEVSTDVVIRCAVVMDAGNGTVSVLPYPGQIELSIRDAGRRIALALETGGAKWSIYCGSCK